MAGAPNITHNYYNNPSSIGWKVTTTDYVTVSAAFVTVLARCYTKFFLLKSRGWDDYTIIMALCVAIGRTACDCVQRYRFGGGRHTWDIPPEWLNGYVTMLAVDGYLYVVAITLAKASLLLFLYRIFHVDRRFRIAAWVVGGMLGIWATVTVFLAIFACRPVKASWNLKLRMDPKTKCEPKSWDVENIYGFCNIITDFALIIMPLPLVWRMQMDRKKKIGVALVFASGVFIFGVAIARQYHLYNPSGHGDPSRSIVETKIWMALEVNLAIIIACLPALTPLFKRVPLLASLIPSIRSKFSQASAMQRRPWPQKLSGPHHDDVERDGGGALPMGVGAPHTSWKTPRAWREAEKRRFDELESRDAESEGSGETGMSVQAMYHAGSRGGESR
ncbi:MAG: hypothetical protein L6R36_006633 [Xanthoria steineri]|nr:MAG: hypothetical protein L6R36_006633 [Xanthoria steineri]